MAQMDDNYHASRPVTPPRRLALPLRGGGQTSVFVHDPPAGVPPRAPVLYVHGIQSHPGWFAGSATAMAQAGHPVFQVTRRGSGDSDAPRGDAKSALQLLDDVTDAARFVAEQTNQPRMHLVGVSWGGKLLAAYAATQQAREAGATVASLTLISPGIVPRVDVSPLVKLKIGLCLLCCPRRLFDIPLSDVDLFTDNPAMRQYLSDDPLRLHRATARFLYASRQLDRTIARLANGCIDIPTRLVLADRDRIINNAATAAVVQRLTGQRAEIVRLSGAHTLEFEENPTPVLQAIASGLLD